MQYSGVRVYLTAIVMLTSSLIAGFHYGKRGRRTGPGRKLDRLTGGFARIG
jgi:hypothetical protein